MRIRGKLIASYSLLVLLILVAFALIIYTTFAEYIKHDRDGYFNMKGKSVFQKLTSAVNGHMQEMELFRVRSGLERFAANRTTASRFCRPHGRPHRVGRDQRLETVTAV